MASNQQQTEALGSPPSQFSGEIHRLRETAALLDKPALWNDFSVFNRLLYKSTNQHRRLLHFHHIHQVQRFLRLLQQYELQDAIVTFANMIERLHGGVVSAEETKDGEQLVPAVERPLQQLLGGALAAQKALKSIRKASSLVAGQLVQTFFMPWALSMLSCLARFHVLLGQLLQEVTECYNQVVRLCEQSSKLPRDFSGKWRVRKLPKQLHNMPGRGLSCDLHPPSAEAPVLTTTPPITPTIDHAPREPPPGTTSDIQGGQASPSPSENTNATARFATSSRTEVTAPPPAAAAMAGISPNADAPSGVPASGPPRVQTVKTTRLRDEWLTMLGTGTRGGGAEKRGAQRPDRRMEDLAPFFPQPLQKKRKFGPAPTGSESFTERGARTTPGGGGGRGGMTRMSRLAVSPALVFEDRGPLRGGRGGGSIGGKHPPPGSFDVPLWNNAGGVQPLGDASGDNALLPVDSAQILENATMRAFEPEADRVAQGGVRVKAEAERAREESSDGREGGSKTKVMPAIHAARERVREGSFDPREGAREAKAISAVVVAAERVVCQTDDVRDDGDGDGDRDGDGVRGRRERPCSSKVGVPSLASKGADSMEGNRMIPSRVVERNKGEKGEGSDVGAADRKAHAKGAELVDTMFDFLVRNHLTGDEAD